MFQRLDHVGISVRNMEKAIKFYEEVIGMTKISDRVYDKEIAEILGEEKVLVRVVHMRYGTQVIELFKYDHPIGRTAFQDPKQSDFGIIHIGFFVENFQDAIKQLKQKGVKFLGNPTEVRPGVFAAYFWGAENEVLEVREIQEIKQSDHRVGAASS